MAFEKLKERARALARETTALWFAFLDPRTPWYGKLVAAAVVGYALSPIDLIPDFIPVLGYLDDLLLVPAGIALAVKLVPKDVLAECRVKAAEQGSEQARSAGRVAAFFVAAVWLAAIILVVLAVIR